MAFRPSASYLHILHDLGERERHLRAVTQVHRNTTFATGRTRKHH